MEQWEPGKPTYNICQAYRLKGGSTSGRSRKASMQSLIGTKYCAHRSLPKMTSCANSSRRFCRLSLATIDLRTTPEAERNVASLHLAQEDARRPFDLAHGPLLRALLIQLDNEECLLVFTVHQMVCDGWSMRILLSEFWQCYEAISRDRLPSLPNVSVQYADFAFWQRQLLSEEWIESQISFWKETLWEVCRCSAYP